MGVRDCPEKQAKDFPLRQLVSTITVEDTPLPKDRRKRPWPTIRKYGFNGIETEMQFMAAIVRKAKMDMGRMMGVSIFQQGE